MKEVFTNVLQSLGLAFWVEVVTEKPRCTYYFGPFTSQEAANDELKGYVEDLEKEGAQGIVAAVKRCKPPALTITEDGESQNGHSNGQVRIFSGQIQ